MTPLDSTLRYQKRFLWILLAAAVVSVLWMVKVEIVYHRNVRHIPANFQLRYHQPPDLWRT